MLALAAVVCAVTFTGAKQPEARPLTGDELAYFNEEFFNNDVSGTNIRNQFLVSLYERPEDIDLYELFYCGTGRSAGMTEEELRQVGSFDESGAQICPTDKLTVADIDAVLLENTGPYPGGDRRDRPGALPVSPGIRRLLSHPRGHQFPWRRDLHRRRAGGRHHPPLFRGFPLRRVRDRMCHAGGPAGRSLWFVSHTLAERPPSPQCTRRENRC